MSISVISSASLVQEALHEPRKKALVDYSQEDAAIMADVKAIQGISPIHVKPTFVVSLRPLKAVADKLALDHPLRILLSGEPENLPVEEYLTKLPGWYRLLRSRE